MKTCSEIIKEATESGDYKGKLQLFTKLESGGTKPTGVHTVKVISSEIVKGSDFKTREERDEVQLVVEEDGMVKTYNFPTHNQKGEPHYLVERFADIEEGSMVELEGKSSAGGSYIDVRPVSSDVVQIDNDDIPIVEEGEDLKKKKNGKSK